MSVRIVTATETNLLISKCDEMCFLHINKVCKWDEGTMNRLKS